MEFFLALKLCFALLVTVFWPGSVVLRLFRLTAGPRNGFERLVWRFLAGYTAISLVCVSVTLSHGSLIDGVVALTLFCGIFEFADLWHRRRSSDAGHTPFRVLPTHFLSSQWWKRFLSLRWVLVVSVLVALIYGWFIEPPIMGEEVVELISARKILESPILEIRSLLHTSNVVPTYVFLPYCFLLAAISKLAGVSIFVAYIKLRALWVVCSIISLWSLGRALGLRNSVASILLIVFGLWFVLDPLPFSWPASFLPLNRRGAVASAVLLPALILLTLRLVQGDRTWNSKWYIYLPLALVACLITHTLEGVFFLFFGVSLLSSSIVMKLSRVGTQLKLTRVIVVFSVILLTAFVFSRVHQSAVGHIQNYLAGHRQSEMAEIKKLLEAPLSMVWSAVPEKGQYVFSKLGSVTYYVLAALVSLPIVASILPFAAILIWANLSIVNLIFGVPILMHVFYFATTPDIFFVSTQQVAWALIGLLVAVVSIFQSVLTQLRSAQWIQRTTKLISVPGLIFLALSAGALSAVALYSLIEVAWDWPSLYPVVSIALAFLGWRLIRRPAKKLGNLKIPGLSLLVASFFAAFVGVMKWRSTPSWAGPRSSMVDVVANQSQLPSVLNWDEYYPLLQKTANPPFDAPFAVSEKLRTILPPLSTVIYDPKYAYSLPMFLNVYIANPGHFLTSDELYYSRFVTEDGGLKVHPIFNNHSEVSDLELEFLDRLKVNYVVVNPRSTTVTEKLNQKIDRFQKILSFDGYTVYKVAPQTH